jgi:hypothetical protein
MFGRVVDCEQSSHHPVIAPAEPGERWLYCYTDQVFAD